MYDAEEHMIAMNLASFKALTPTKKFMETKNEMRNLSYSNDGFGMVVSGEDVIFVYDLNEGTKVKSIECMKYGVGVVNYFDKDLCLHTSNSQKIVEHHVRLLNIQTKAYVKYFLGHTKTVNGIVKKPQDPPNFLTSSLDKTIRFWDSRTYENIGFININHVPLVAYDPDGLIFAVATDSGTIKLFDVRSFDIGPFRTFRIMKNDNDEWTNIEFSSCGKFILVSTKAESIKWIDSFHGKIVHSFSGHSNPNAISLTASISPDSQFVVVGSDDNQMYIYSTESGEIVHKLKTGVTSPCHYVAFNQKQFMMTTLSEEVLMWAPSEDYAP